MPFNDAYRPGMSADDFAAAGNPGRPQPTGNVDLAMIRDARRDIGRVGFEFAANYYGNDSPEAQAALEKLRALGDSPHARAELVPATREVQPLSQAEMLARLRAADPASRRASAAPDPAFVQQVVTEVMRTLPKR